MVCHYAPWPLGCLPLPIPWLRRHIPPTAGPLTFLPQRAAGAAPHPNSWSNAPQSLGMTLHANPLYRACWCLDQQAGCQAGSTPPTCPEGQGAHLYQDPLKCGGRGWGERLCRKNEHQRVSDPTGCTATWSPQSLLKGSTQPRTLMPRGLPQLPLHKPIASVHTSFLTGPASHECHCLPTHLCTSLFFISFTRLEATRGQASPLCDLQL